MKWDENETLHLIMMMVKKLYKENYLHKNFFKKFSYYYYPPLPPAFSFSSLLSENRNKITQKMFYPWIHYAVQNWLSLNKIALQ